MPLQVATPGHSPADNLKKLYFFSFFFLSLSHFLFLIFLFLLFHLFIQTFIYQSLLPDLFSITIFPFLSPFPFLFCFCFTFFLSPHRYCSSSSTLFSCLNCSLLSFIRLYSFVIFPSK